MKLKLSPKDPIDGSEDFLDSRDVEARIDELEGRDCDCRVCPDCDGKTICAKCSTCARCSEHARSDGSFWHRGSRYIGCEGCENGDDPLDEEEVEELVALKEFRDDIWASDWHHGETLINDDYFETYAREFAEDTGAVGRNESWPKNFIDWPAACDALKQDYSSAELFGNTFWARC